MVVVRVVGDLRSNRKVTPIEDYLFREGGGGGRREGGREGEREGKREGERE